MFLTDPDINQRARIPPSVRCEQLALLLFNRRDSVFGGLRVVDGGRTEGGRLWFGYRV